MEPENGVFVSSVKVGDKVRIVVRTVSPGFDNVEGRTERVYAILLREDGVKLVKTEAL